MVTILLTKTWVLKVQSYDQIYVTIMMHILVWKGDITIEGDNDDKASFNRINKNKIIRSKSFEYKTKLMGTTPNNNTLDIDVVIPLKYLSNFWRFFDFSLVNSERELDLAWSKEYVISEISKNVQCQVIQMLVHLFRPWQQCKQLEKRVK